MMPKRYNAEQVANFILEESNEEFSVDEDDVIEDMSDEDMVLQDEDSDSDDEEEIVAEVATAARSIPAALLTS